MESSQVYGGRASEEECHSNESGWTMYIGDSYEEDDDDIISNNINGDSYEKQNNNNNNNNNNDDDEDTDDSMASDASSGPSHWWVNGKVYSKNDKDSSMRGKNGYTDKNCSVPKYKPKNSSVKIKKKDGGDQKEEDDESIHSAKSSHRERRSFWKGKTGK